MHISQKIIRLKYSPNTKIILTYIQIHNSCLYIFAAIWKVTKSWIFKMNFSIINALSEMYQVERHLCPLTLNELDSKSLITKNRKHLLDRMFFSSYWPLERLLSTITTKWHCPAFQGHTTYIIIQLYSYTVNLYSPYDLLTLSICSFEYFGKLSGWGYGGAAVLWLGSGLTFGYG